MTSMNFINKDNLINMKKEKKIQATVARLKVKKKIAEIKLRIVKKKKLIYKKLLKSNKKT
jgi:hypothetical protein